MGWNPDKLDCASTEPDAKGEGVRLNRCSILIEMDGRMMTPDEVSSGSLLPVQKPRQNLNSHTPDVAACVRHKLGVL